MRIRALLPLVGFSAIAIFLGIGLGLNPRLVPSPLIEKPTPRFSLPELHEPARTVTREDLRGEVSLLNVWASWCVACRQEHPLLMSLANAGAVSIYGLNYKDERDDAILWLARFGNPYRAIAADRDGRVGIDWGVYGVPETFVVDRNGVKWLCLSLQWISAGFDYCRVGHQTVVRRRLSCDCLLCEAME